MLCNVVGAKAQSIELSLLSKFAGATWYNAAGNVVTTGWTNKLITITDPAVTIQAPEGKNVMGWYTKTSGRWPALQAGNVFTVRVPQGYEFTGYTLTTQATTVSNKSTFTYTTAEGQTESVTQQTSDSKVIVEGLNTSEIIIDLTNYSVSGTHGIVISGFDVTVQKLTYVKAEVAGMEANNPNTHFGNVRFISESGDVVTANLKRSENPVALSLGGLQAPTVDFTRAYRGFDFQGFYVGEQSLGKSFTLTDAIKNSITAEAPLVAKFTTTSDVTLFYDDDDFSYRIPAIATTSTGRIIAVSDYRHNLDDIGRDVHNTGTLRIDLVMRYSDDYGKTWSEKQTIAEGTGNKGAEGYDCAYGDATIATLGEKVLVMAAAGNVCYPYATAEKHNRTVRLFSEDNGKTWTKEDISEKMFIGANAMIPNGHAAFFGSGKLAVDAAFNGTDNARIYGAMLVKDESAGSNVYVVYTDDLGQNWKVLGGKKVANADEPKVEILPNGQILLSARRQGGRLFNVFTYGNGDTDKSNGVGTWDEAANGCDNGGKNGTNGEIFLVDAKNSEGAPVKLLMQSQPKGGTGHYDRRDVTIWYKEVDANTAYTTATIKTGWVEGLQVSQQLSSYSVATLQTDGRIGFFFEEAPCFGDDYTKGYCMVYKPLTIENITRGNYYSATTDLDAEATVEVILTDAEGNTYKEQLTECKVGDIAAKLQEKYPFITLGGDVNLVYDGAAYIYTNTVTLPFKVSNSDTTIWHNIYFPANTNENGYPVYLSANSENATVVTKVTEKQVYGNSSYNTNDYADKISWAIYHVDNGFTFKLQNKLTRKFIQATSVATGDSNNVNYVEEANATAFELIPDAASYRGDYSLRARVGESVGYLCSTSVSYGNATHYNANNHQGAWVKITEAPDFEALIAEVNSTLSTIDTYQGAGLGQYSFPETSANRIEEAKTAMQRSGAVKLNDLNSYKLLMDDAVLNLPQSGQFFRVAYDYGDSVGKLYMQSTTSSVKGVEFAAETGSASIWVYYDGALYSYKTGQCLRETGNERGLQAVGGKTTATFAESTRAMGKYNITCYSYVHANNNAQGYFSDHCSSNSCAQHDLILEAVEHLPVSITAAGYATFFAPVAVKVAEGVTAYTVRVNGDWATLTEIESGVVPANTGVVLQGDANEYNFEFAENSTTVEGNELRGTVAASYITDDAYVLSYVTADEVGFGIALKNQLSSTAWLNNAFKAYLPKPAGMGTNALRFNKPGTTGIESALNNGVPAEQPIYDLSGRRITTTVKGGFYIQNGKKFILK